MKYTVTFGKCGHTADIELFGKVTDREWKIKQYEKSGMCPECYKKWQEEQRQQDKERKIKEANDRKEEDGLPDLTGSDKQLS